MVKEAFKIQTRELNWHLSCLSVWSPKPIWPMTKKKQKKNQAAQLVICTETL